MKTFKQFQEEMNKPSISAAAKTGKFIANPIALVLKALYGMLKGKHKRTFKSKERS